MRGRVLQAPGGVNRAMPRWNFCICITEKPFWEGRVACASVEPSTEVDGTEDLLYLAEVPAVIVFYVVRGFIYLMYSDGSLISSPFLFSLCGKLEYTWAVFFHY